MKNIVDRNIKQYIKDTKGAILWLGHKNENFYVVRRLFTARRIEDKEMKEVLNENVESSEYLPSQKYAVIDNLDNRKRKFSVAFKTKTDAVKWIYNYFKNKEMKNEKINN